ncbi:endothelin-converting enzyme 1-like isoform X1 [Neodiprion virginianus]|uniref:endothelin-converting enzyme 1-like isoform X1 n=1 Tax=Neodiprion virginianus TaxID=2961670 RepID=UPI001EE78043|nr:endothelin-converting enzyme 1-like isoform X1 [Neodiprion virginianus]
MRLIVVTIFIQLPFLIRMDNLFPYVDYSKNPCDDFYTFACGNFQNVHPVPEGYSIWDGFIRLQREVDERLKELLENERSVGDSKSFVKAQDMYAACIDTKTRDRRGISTMLKVLEEIWPKKNEESTMSKITSADWRRMARFVANYGVQFFFKLTVRTDIWNATKTSIYIEHDDLTLPTALLRQPVRILDNDFSSRTDSTFIEYLSKIMIILRDFTQSDISDYEISAKARSINEFMNVLADPKELNYGRDTAKTNIPNVGSTTLAKLQAWTDEVLDQFTDTINWRTYLQIAFKKSRVKVNNDTQIFITNRSLLRNLLIYAHETGKELLNDFVYSRMVTFMAPELSSEMYNISMDFYINRGYVPPGYPTWKYCLHKVLDFPKIGLSFTVAQKYREKYVSEERIKRAQEMMENLRDALEELIDEAEWMDDFTKNYAIYKLNSILILTGSPDYLKTESQVDQYYRKLKIYRYDHFGNMNRLRSFSQWKNFAELRIYRNRNSWTQSPLIVNAYYNGINNRILFPISTMAEPFFSGNSGSFFDYARIGSVMAHELTHAFDSQGRLLDAEGSLKGWWSQSTEQVYATKIKCFIKQYNQYISGDSEATIDGKYTLSENIADNVGLRAAFRAFTKERNKLPALYHWSRFNNFMSDKYFYLAFASIWCHTGATEHSDKHAPHKYRILGPIQNMENFAKTWQCYEMISRSRTNAMNSWERADKDICILW